ncbi:uncharacterized protein CXorf57 [Sinocyclocheilus anshuiensis]|nr:PREDICTED: uncharacterized protein CXorf57-like [Sinocyclocheilus anshuiensis]
MAALSGSSSECCTLKKILNRLISTTSSSPRARTRSEPLYVISLERYGRDADFALRFPDSISMSESLFDATITDGDCKIRVSLDPAVNRLISVNVLHCGSVIRHVELSRGEDSASFHACSLEVDRLSGGNAALRALSSVNVRAIPWMGAEPSAGPLRARRSSYLPLWNNHDFSGEMWRDAPPSEPDAEDSEEEIDDIGSTVSLAEVRRHFLSGSRRYRGALCVRILHKSRLIYYGKADQKCECPYKAELQVGDGSSSACVVLWNTVCLEWYRILHPGQVVRLCRYRVKESYSSRTGQESEPHIGRENIKLIYVCCSTGSHPVMPYRGIRPIRQFLRWLKQVDESSLLERAVIGGYFRYPPLPVSLHNFMENRHGEAGLISGGEMKLQCEKLIYREKQQFAIQCVITAACYHHREDSGRTQYSDIPSAPLSPRVRRQREGSEPHRTPVKRKLFSSTSPRKRLAPPLQPLATEDDAERDFSLFDGAMEFLVGEQEDDSNDEDEDGDFLTPPTSPMTARLGLTRVANETLPRVFCYERRHVQAVAVGLQVNNFHKLLPQRELESFSPASCYTGYFTLTMRALSDGVMLDVLFLPAAPGNLHWMPLPLSHNNSWESVLSHGGFSPHAPPPSPADLIATANQLTNQRLLCVLDACALGGEKMELVLNRAFPLR